ncbi:MAG: hypothetical protein IEMM0002_0003 [bacterium]|nr:MAG: hypothetical protein IEMM0002_0003 [bacterium]
METITTLGDKLKREREVRGVTLDEISQATNIRTSFLSAMEGNDFLTLPGPVFVTGFLRSYSAHLGLDADKIVAEYESLGIADPDELYPSPTENIENDRFSIAAVIAVLVLMLAGYLIYTNWPNREEPEKPHSITEKAKEPIMMESQPQENPHQDAVENEVSEPEQTIQTVPASEMMPEDTAPKPAQAAEPAIASAKTAAKPESASLVEAKISPAKPGTSSVTRKSKKTSLNNGYKYRLVITAESEDVWVLVDVDNEVTHDLFVRTDRPVVLRANKSFILTSGNAKSMKLRLNGKPMNFKMPRGNVIRKWSIPLPG